MEIKEKEKAFFLRFHKFIKVLFWIGREIKAFIFMGQTNEQMLSSLQHKKKKPKCEAHKNQFNQKCVKFLVQHNFPEMLIICYRRVIARWTLIEFWSFSIKIKKKKEKQIWRKKNEQNVRHVNIDDATSDWVVIILHFFKKIF